MLLKEVAGRARRSVSAPVDESVIRTALDSVRQDYLAISMEAAAVLRSIDETKSVDGLRQDDLVQLGRYFQALVVLQVAKWGKMVYNSSADAETPDGDFNSSGLTPEEIELLERLELPFSTPGQHFFLPDLR